VHQILTSLELPAEQITHAAQTEAIKLHLHQQTETAVRRGIFGAPTFFVGGEMFWGNDRLEDALTLARSSG
jgi:2-hydroxychromene-2-carboxylate isomerase